MEANGFKGGTRPRSPVTIGFLLLIMAAVLGACRSAEPTADSGITGESDSGHRALSARDLVPVLTRYGVGPGGVGLDLTYAVPMFFAVTGLQPPAELASRPTLAFFVQETIHEGDLVADLPAVFLELSDGSRVRPYSKVVTAADPHHRTTRLLFPDPEGQVSGASGGTVRLVVPSEDGSVSVAGTFEWRLPLDVRARADHATRERSR